MRTGLKLSAFVLMWVALGAAWFLGQQPQTANAATTQQDAIRLAHRTTHQISEASIVGGRHNCSGTAIAPHAILTASHCEQPTDTLAVDGPKGVMMIQGVERDGYDHTIYEVSGTFKNFSEFSDTPLRVGDNVFIFGNPGQESDVLRKGYVAREPEKATSLLAEIMSGGVDRPYVFDLNGFFGDSGSAVFNEDGKIAGIISMIASQAVAEPDEPPVSQNLMLGYALHFTPYQIEKVEKFTPGPVPAGKLDR